MIDFLTNVFSWSPLMLWMDVAILSGFVLIIDSYARAKLSDWMFLTIPLFLFCIGLTTFLAFMAV